MKPHVVKFLQFLEAKEGKNAPLKYKLLNPDKFKITKDDLIVKGDLYLSNTNITSLPDDLQISGDLYLNNCTSLQSLPDGLKAGWNLLLKNTPLAKMYSAGEIRDIIESNGGYVNGTIYIQNNKEL